MVITKVSYGRTVNLGNYQSARIDMEAELEPNESYEQGLEKLRELVKIECTKEARRG